MQHVMEFFGRLHPAIVHLPIGILLLFSFFVWLRHRLHLSPEVLTLILGIGAISAILSVVTGLVLSSEGEYGGGRADIHKWMGIITAIVSVLFSYLAKKSESKEPILKLASGFMFVLVVVTGHLGNDLVRGTTYLTEPLTAMVNGSAKDEVTFEGDIEEALVYEDIIQPILESKCYSCHGEQKQKGRLRLDLPEHILKGGKNGKILIVGSASDSELITRINLPDDDDDHMPPKEKKQLSAKEIAWLAAWIEHGADFSKKTKEVISAETLSALTSAASNNEDDLADVHVAEPDRELISSLVGVGVAISAIGSESNLLQVNMVSVPAQVDSLIKVAAKLGDNVISLKLGSTPLSDQGATSLAAFKNLRRLSLEDTKITDATLVNVTLLNHLKYLNLNGTGVTIEGIEKLSALRELQSLFLYHTSVTREQIEQLKTKLPGVNIELGNYSVPTLESDTTVVVPK